MKKCVCGSELFKAEISTVAILNVTDDGKYQTQQIFDEYTQTDKLYCIECEAEYTLESFTNVKCTRCGKEFKAEEVNENGRCEICEALSKYDNLSKEEIVLKMLNLEKELAQTKTSKRNTRKKPAKKKDEEVKEEVNAEVPATTEVKEEQPIEKTIEEPVNEATPEQDFIPTEEPALEEPIPEAVEVEEIPGTQETGEIQDVMNFDALNEELNKGNEVLNFENYNYNDIGDFSEYGF